MARALPPGLADRRFLLATGCSMGHKVKAGQAHHDQTGPSNVQRGHSNTEFARNVLPVLSGLGQGWVGGVEGEEDESDC